MAQKRRTQAVIIIHGIGEQRPMDTLRSFVGAVLPEPPQGGEKFFSKPDRLSELFELRLLQGRVQPRTHFFEYYWAYKLEGTLFRHIWQWTSSLLFRAPGRVPSHLRFLWYLSWFLIVVAVVAALGAVVSGYFGKVTARIPPLLISLASMLLLAVVQGFVLYRLGDAARYLSPHPNNIKLRQEIRADGIKLLKSIHESQDPVYDRVVIVGHSLGSVIAYDILKHAWQEYNQVYRQPTESQQPALAAAEAAGESLRSGAADGGLQHYRDQQKELWWELRSLGNPWLVTDLVTLGSPLAHAALLLASDAEDLRARQRQRELPTDPPVAESDAHGRPAYSFRVWERYEDKYVLRALHHAALFACTRWTNLYFPVRLGIFGDAIGGPLNGWFGPGIRDIAVRSRSRLRSNTLMAHTSYWRSEDRQTGVGQDPAAKETLPLALQVLTEALDLEGTYTYRPLEKSDEKHDEDSPDALS